MDATTPPQSLQGARERLAQTRRELLRHMGQRAGLDAPDSDESAAPAFHTRSEEGTDAGHRGESGFSTGGLRQGLRAWWRSQPAHLALELGQPVFEKYARTHPLKVLAIGAGAGAVLVLVRPWRLISVTGVLVAALKSAQLSALASEVLRSPRAQRPGPPADGPPPPR